GDCLLMDHRGQRDRIEVKLTADGESQTLTARHVAPDNWEHIALSLGDGEMRLFVNGEQRGKISTPIELFEIAPKAAGLEVNAAFIGRDRDGRHFSGDLDNLKFFHDVLDQPRIERAMLEDASPRQLVNFREESRKQSRADRKKKSKK
ncbi:MAG: LamG-like jellyroll fold domain-containing protein, partial [Planctomycetota bacterium]